MKRILHICLAINYLEGWAYQENMLPAAHKELGYDVHIIAAEQYFDEHKKVIVNRPIGDYENNDGVIVHLLRGVTMNYSLNRFLPKVRNLYKTIDEIKPDIIFWHGLDPCGYNSFQVSWYIKKHPHVKLYADCHADYYNRGFAKHPLKSKIDIIISRFWYLPFFSQTKKIWGTTPWRVVYLKNEYHLSSPKVDCLIMGADDKHIVTKDKKQIRAHIRDRYSIPQDAFLIVSGGKLDKAKNLHLLCSAVKEIGAPVFLLLFGKPTPDMESIFESYKDCENIIQLGWIDGSSTYDLFLASDLACFPGTHSVLWEQSIACGIPGIFKHWEHMTHVNVTGNASFVEEVTEESIKNALRVIMEKEHYDNMIKAANIASHQFLMSSIAKKAIEE